MVSVKSCKGDHRDFNAELVEQVVRSGWRVEVGCDWINREAFLRESGGIAPEDVGGTVATFPGPNLQPMQVVMVAGGAEPRITAISENIHRIQGDGVGQTSAPEGGSGPGTAGLSRG